MTQGMMKALQEPLTTIFLAIGIFVTLVYWHLPLSNTLVLLFLIGRVIKQLTKIQERYSEIAILEGSYWSFQKTIRNLNKQREVILGTKLPIVKESLSLEDVSFSYGDGMGPKNVNILFPRRPDHSHRRAFRIREDHHSGFGGRLAPPSRGRGSAGRGPSAAFDLKRWRQMIGYVPQETILLHDTIFNNVTFGRKKPEKRRRTGGLQAAGAIGIRGRTARRDPSRCW